MAERLERKLRESQMKTVMTRSSDVFIPLDERVAIENRQRNAIFVSIHFNDSRRRGIHGFETYYHSGNSDEIARRIQAKLMTIPHSMDRGVHVANFRVLRKANYPAVLVECGFLSNRKDGRQAGDSEYREMLADRIAEAIVEQRYGTGVYRGSTQSCSSTSISGNAELIGTASTLKLFAALLAAHCRNNDQREENHKSEKGKTFGIIWPAGVVAEMFGQSRFDYRGIGREEIANLVSEPREGATHFAGREFIQVHRHNAPGALHHELHGEPADHQRRYCRREYPKLESR